MATKIHIDNIDSEYFCNNNYDSKKKSNLDLKSSELERLKESQKRVKNAIKKDKKKTQWNGLLAFSLLSLVVILIYALIDFGQWNEKKLLERFQKNNPMAVGDQNNVKAIISMNNIPRREVNDEILNDEDKANKNSDSQKPSPNQSVTKEKSDPSVTKFKELDRDSKVNVRNIPVALNSKNAVGYQELLGQKNQDRKNVTDKKLAKSVLSFQNIYKKANTTLIPKVDKRSTLIKVNKTATSDLKNGDSSKEGLLGYLTQYDTVSVDNKNTKRDKKYLTKIANMKVKMQRMEKTMKTMGEVANIPTKVLQDKITSQNKKLEKLRLQLALNNKKIFFKIDKVKAPEKKIRKRRPGLPFKVIAVDWTNKEPVLGILEKGNYEHIRKGESLKGWKLMTVSESEAVFRQGDRVIKKSIY